MRLIFHPHNQASMRARRSVTKLGAALGIALSLSLSGTRSHAAEVTPSAKSISEIKAPYYGDTLFDFFQDHYFTSVTNLMVSQHFNRIAAHTEEAEVLRGGILLSYGLQREAGEIFTRLLNVSATPSTRDRAWFYLAKISYQRGYRTQAEEAINHIGNALTADLKEERTLLQANLLMARGDYSKAASLLSTVNAGMPWAAYSRFNLGVALIRSGNNAAGSAVLDQLGLASAGDEEYRSLRDRANLALGLSALKDNRPEMARTYLERVRLKSPQASKALLGLGWSANALKDPKLALAPWLELAQGDINDTAVLEAQIAVPYAYAALGAYAQATERYNQAIATFTLEDAGLNESIAAIHSGKLVDALINSNPGEELGWFWSMRDITAMPHASHLAHILGQHEFQESFKNYRDLRFLTKNLTEWRDKLKTFEDMLDNRRIAFAERLPQVLERTKEIGIEPLKTRYASAAQAVTAAEQAADGVAFADGRQIDLLKRIANVKVALKDATDVPELDTGLSRVRLADGILTWQLAQDFPARLWQAKKELQTITEELDKAQRLGAALTQAQSDEPARFEAFAQRITAMKLALDLMIPRVAALSEEQQRAVQNIAVTELAHQQERLTAYATQARFAVAQLYDRSTEQSQSRNQDHHQSKLSSQQNKEAENAK